MIYLIHDHITDKWQCTYLTSIATLDDFFKEKNEPHIGPILITPLSKHTKSRYVLKGKVKQTYLKEHL